MKKKILVCCNVYPPHFIGGAELIAHYQAKTLQQMGHQVVVFAGGPQAGSERYSVKRERYDGLLVYRVCLHPTDYRAEFINFFHRRVEQHFETLLNEFSPDVVHIHNVIGLSVGLMRIAGRKNIKVVLTLHDHWGFCHKNTLIKLGTEICGDYRKCAECLPFVKDEDGNQVPIRLRRDFLAVALRSVDVFISPSQYLADAYIRAGFPPERFRVIWYGMDVRRFEKIAKVQDGEHIRFSLVSYMGRHKGVHTLLEALPLLSRKRKVKINFVGEGAERDSYERRARELGWEKSVRFWGHVDNRSIERVYQETDVLVLPSVWPENQPVSITEAMASRIPVIASRIGGIPELVEDGNTGYLFEAGNTRDLAQKMSTFIEDPSQVNAFGENAFRKIARNTLESQVRRIAEVYDEEIRLRDAASLADESLIVCLGKRIEQGWAHALNSWEDRDSWKFVMAEWVDEELLQKAKLLWIVDKGASMADVEVGLKSQIPLLVPEDNVPLADLCRYGQCGLYYKDAFEVMICIEYLMKNEAIRRAMGQNGHRLISTMGAP
jgi:glycosyltransferase involved in cell wall biosynthesis